MRAVRFHGFGGPDVLRFETVEPPRPGAAEALVRVHAASVNPVDCKTRRGRTGLCRRFPFTPGWDVSGVVEAVGPDVAGFAPGDEVFGLVRFPEEGAAYAERCAVPADHLAHKPGTISHVEACALPLVALTAWQALTEVAKVGPGQTVLVHGAAGGVGHLAVQLAKRAGGRVIGTCSARNRLFLLGLGADDVVDYATTRFDDVLRDVDVVVDPFAREVRDRSWSVVRDGGLILSLVGGPFDVPGPHRHRCRGRFMRVEPSGPQLAGIARLVDEGQLRVSVQHVLPLEQAAEAHRLSETGHVRGKIVLEVQPSGSKASGVSTCRR